MRYQELMMNVMPKDVAILVERYCRYPTPMILACEAPTEPLYCLAGSRPQFGCGISEELIDPRERYDNTPVQYRRNMAARNLALLKQDLLVRLQEIEAAERLLAS